MHSKSFNSQNPFCHILETLNKNYEKKMAWYVHSVQIYIARKSALEKTQLSDDLITDNLFDSTIIGDQNNR